MLIYQVTRHSGEPRIPSLLIDEELATGKMAEAEQVIEDK